MYKYLNACPYLTVPQAYFVLRLALALFFMIHSLSRFIEPDYFSGLGQGLASLGMPYGYALGVIATGIELAGGTLLILNKFAKWVALGLFSISAVGIVFIHTKFGWFVGEFGNGGAEFSVALCASCLVIAAYDREAQKKQFATRSIGVVQ